MLVNKILKSIQQGVSIIDLLDFILLNKCFTSLVYFSLFKAKKKFKAKEFHSSFIYLLLTVSSLSWITLTGPSFSIEPPKNICPTSLGFALLVMSYCLISPCTQLLKYKYLSSNDNRMSVITPVNEN